VALVPTFGTALCRDIGFALLTVRGDHVAERARGGFRPLLAGYVRDPLWLVGLFFQPLGYALYLWALEIAPLNIVQPAMSSGVILFVLFAVCAWGERLTRLDWGAIRAVVVGMILRGVSLSPGAEHSQSRIDPHLVLDVSLLLVGLCVAAWFTLMGSGQPDARGIPLGIGSGVLLGLASISAGRLALVLEQSPPGHPLRQALSTPYAPLTLVANMAGFSLLLGAFRGNRASIVLALSGTLSTVIPILGGMVALGERLPPDLRVAPSRLLAFALTLGGTALLVRVTLAATGR